MSKKYDSVHIIGIIRDGYIIHSVAFLEAPTVNTVKHIFDELKTDPEFDIQDINDCRTIIVPFKYFKKVIPRDLKKMLIESIDLLMQGEGHNHG